MWWKMLMPWHSSIMRCTWVLWSTTSYNFIMFGCDNPDKVCISRWTAFAATSVTRLFLSYVLIAITCLVSLCYALLTIAKAPWPIYKPIWKSFKLNGYSSGLVCFLVSIKPRNAFNLLIDLCLRSSWSVSFFSTLLMRGEVSTCTCFGLSSVFGSFFFRLLIGESRYYVFDLTGWLTETTWAVASSLGRIGVIVDFFRSVVIGIYWSFEVRLEFN